MKRTVPLLITAIGGFVLIIATFIPATQGWGEVAAIWFDVLAAIAFILGGGNLLKVQLKKISDRQAGWGYAAVTILAFFTMFVVGMLKVGSQPAANQEHFGESFVPLPLAALPVFPIEGMIPERADGEKLPASVRRQLSQKAGEIEFRGWMLGNQKKDLLDYQDTLEWQCTVERLFDQSQPTGPLKGKILYYADHSALSFKGYMSDEASAAMLKLSNEGRWKAAHDELRKNSSQTASVPLESMPKGVEIPDSLQDVVSHDGKTLTIKGPMSPKQRDTLANRFPVAKPLQGARRDSFRGELEALGNPLSEEQIVVFNKTLDGSWTVEQLQTVLTESGKAQRKDKTACEMLEEKLAGVKIIDPKKEAGDDTQPTPEQLALLESFATADAMTAEQLVEQLKEAGELTDDQEEALIGFLSRTPSIGQRNKALCFILLRAGPLDPKQREFLFADHQREYAWKATVGELFAAAHTTKYVWSGDYREQGSPFWWLYEYAFKPLTATMFAMLAFYVASAAFRAFRAKNVEATLLLGTAFIILLGRTFAGVMLTSWMPESIAGLRIENLTLYIMTVFNTAGNRAIMIGIALGIASTSLRVLLGVDRSYLGSQDE